MISIFIYKDVKDLDCWLWNNDNTPNGVAQPVRGSKRNELARVRNLPLRSIVLDPEYTPFCDFRNEISKKDENVETTVESLRKFMQKLQEKIASIWPNYNNDPICVFIHFGGETYKDFNDRIGRAWFKLEDKEKASFLCFAITRGGNGINEKWVKEDKKLWLPSSQKEVIDVLEKGCQSWDNDLHCPETFKNCINNNPSEDNKANKDKSEDGIENPREQEKTGCKEILFNKGKGCLKFLLIIAVTVLVVLESIAGFVLSWIKCFLTQSSVQEICFGILALVFLVIFCGILLSLHDDEIPRIS